MKKNLRFKEEYYKEPDFSENEKLLLARHSKEDQVRLKSIKTLFKGVIVPKDINEDKFMKMKTMDLKLFLAKAEAWFTRNPKHPQISKQFESYSVALRTYCDRPEVNEQPKDRLANIKIGDDYV